MSRDRLGSLDKGHCCHLLVSVRDLLGGGGGAGKLAEFFTIILTGHAEVAIGKENLIFEQGPFGLFGHGALLPPAGKCNGFDITRGWGGGGGGKDGGQLTSLPLS